MQPQAFHSMGVGALPQQQVPVAMAAPAAVGAPQVIVVPMMAPTSRRAWRNGMK
jgi:hypothetical protein